MIASGSLPTHYNESIFKQQQQQQQQLNAVDSQLASAPTESENGHDEAKATASAFRVAKGSTSATPKSMGGQPSATNGHSVGSVALNGQHHNNHQNGRLSTNNNNNAMTNSSGAFMSSHPELHQDSFIRDCVDVIIRKAVFDGTNRSSKVVDWHAPHELQQLIDFKLPQQGVKRDELMHLLQQTIQYSVKTGHPYFINQLYSGVDPYALIGQWATDALNPSVYTYEVSPVFTLMEEQVLAEMRRIVGFPNGGDGDGLFCPGGSIANGFAISCARFHHQPESKKTGLFGSKRLIVFTSEDAHYSVEKLAMFMGFGSDNVCKVPTNKLGKMDLAALEDNIKKFESQGCQPLMVSATAGTTVLGAFDDLQGIADICEKYKMWMHVDAAWGGGALVSKKYRHLLKGIERSDSVTWNPHKLLTASQQCSTFLTKHKNLLSQCHSTNATYLFQKDKFYDTAYDTGDKHIQCGRRADVFKFWFMWKAKGTDGLEQHVQRLFEMSEYFRDKVRARPGFELVLESPECVNISFWYVPPSLRGVADRNKEFYDKLHKVAPQIKEAMIKKGSMMITYQPLRQLPNFFRLVLQNSCLTEQDMDYFLDEIELLGKHL